MSKKGVASNLHQNNILEHLDIFKCTECHHSELSSDGKKISCPNCDVEYRFIGSVLDALKDPSAATMKELTGMSLENGIGPEDWRSFLVRNMSKISGISEKLDQTKNIAGQYYLQTSMNFDQAFSHLENLSGKRVLEIGATYDFYFLKKFAEAGSECWGLNLHYDLDEKGTYDQWPFKVIADMNKLPFNGESFDVVLISATSHHSCTPEVLTSEIERILKPSGNCLMINDPIDGLLKSLGGSSDHDRHDHINENEYTIWRYNKMFRKSGFSINHLFSSFHISKIESFDIHQETRFAWLAKSISFLYKIPIFRKLFLRYGLWVGQAIFGFPMNVVLTKPKK